MKNALNKMHDFNCLHSDGCLRIERKEFLCTAIAKHLCFANSTHTLIANQVRTMIIASIHCRIGWLCVCVCVWKKLFHHLVDIGFAGDLCDNTNTHTHTHNYSRSNGEQMYNVYVWIICLCAHIDATKSLFIKLRGNFALLLFNVLCCCRF